VPARARCRPRSLEEPGELDR
jgi:hypothetical protein